MRNDSKRVYAMESPLIKQGQVAALKVKALTSIGAFLDWGLEKDLLLPFKEQTFKPSVGQYVVVGLYTDHTGRPCATMRLKNFMKDDPHFAKDQMVSALVYEVRPGTGVLVVVEGQYFGLIPEQDWRGIAKVGETMEVRVVKTRQDGKIDLTPRKKAYKQIDDDAKMLLEFMKAKGGHLGFDEKASPDHIKHVTGLSKASFKRAVGRLLRDALIIEKDGDIVINHDT